VLAQHVHELQADRVATLSPGDVGLELFENAAATANGPARMEWSASRRSTLNGAKWQQCVHA
jgi:hypothetical protein